VSCAHWLSWRIGLDPGTAREKVRVARALGGLPKIDEALGRGVLSYAKVRAMTRVATPENEERLLELALATTGAQLEKLCRRFRRVVDLVNDERLDDQRFLRHEVLPSGLVRITAVLQPDEARLVMEAVAAARLSPPSPDVSAEAQPPMLSAADGLTRVAESFLARGDAAGCGGDRHQVVVHLDQDPLAADGNLAATLGDGSRVSAETFRRLACDSGLVPMVHDQHGRTVDVGRRTRSIPPSLRRALQARDGGCQFPGCTHRLYLHAHHIHHWAHGGPTAAENLVLLCSAHHRLVHEGGFAVSRTSQSLEFRDPRGRRLDQSPAPAPAADWAWDDGIDGDTNLPQWDGRPVDYDAALAVLWETRAA
jgi:hypothetical protein